MWELTYINIFTLKCVVGLCEHSCQKLQNIFSKHCRYWHLKIFLKSINFGLMRKHRMAIFDIHIHMHSTNTWTKKCVPSTWSIFTNIFWGSNIQIFQKIYIKKIPSTFRKPQCSFYIFKEFKKESCFQNLPRLDANFPLNQKMLLPYIPNLFFFFVKWVLWYIQPKVIYFFKK